MDVLDFVEPIQQEKELATLAKVLLKERKSSTSLRQAPREKWSSDLDPRDLRCLLSVLETQLIPRLISDYSPAACAPLVPGDTGS